VIAFRDHWKAVSGNDPAMLIMDQKVTTHAVLGELDDRGAKFLTLRVRSPTLVNHIGALTAKDFTTVTLNRPGKSNRPKYPKPPVCDSPTTPAPYVNSSSPDSAAKPQP
jgi:hypothetical protein